MEAPAQSTAAVSLLMQQLKNGDISKMQLFQQLAKLQARGAGVTSPASIAPPPQHLPPPPPPEPVPIVPFGAFSRTPAASTLTSMPLQNQIAANQPASFGFATDTYAPFGQRNSSASAASTAPSMAQSLPPGAKIVEGNAEFLATGVSHDKVPSFSVKEWMASKSRASIASSIGPPRQDPPRREPSDGDSQPHSAVHALFPSHGSGSAAQFDPVAGSLSADKAADPTASSYVYTPQRYYDSEPRSGVFTGTGRQGDADGKESAYIDFTEHFRADLDRSLDDNRPSMRGTGGESGAAGGGAGAADEDKFHARVTRWKSQKEAIREQMKQQLLQSELSECTFAPKVNPKSTKVVAKLRGRQPDNKAGGIRSSPLAVSERLYQEADSYKAREELAAKMKAEEEVEMARECTFRPRINRASSLTDKVKAKYLEPPPECSPSLAAATMEAAAKELSECTFQPKVNPISGDMLSAQLYLQQDIYERLSRPCLAGSDAGSRTERRPSRSLFSDDESDADSADDGHCMRSPRPRGTQDDLYVRSEGGGRRKLRGRRASGSRERGRERERPRSAGGVQTDEDKADRARQFESFLERQKFHEQARAKRIAQTTQQLTPGYKPNINKASQQMMENGRKGDFLERITKYALRKEYDTVKSKTVRVSDPHCTFKPSINQASAKRKARSVTELSRGDLLRRETTQRLMKLKMEQEEMAALTFRPQLNRVSERHEGRLKILSSPDTYLQRIQQQSQAHTVKQRRALQAKELEEFAECTFKPRTIEAPAYVQRIARSVSLTKALKQQRQAAAKASDKPEWK